MVNAKYTSVYKQNCTNTIMQTLKMSKQLHNKYPQALVKTETSYLLKGLKYGQLFGENEGFIVAIQNNVIPTRNYQKYVSKLSIVTGKCWISNSQTEIIQHKISGCRVITEYLKWHNLTTAIIHETTLKIRY